MPEGDFVAYVLTHNHNIVSEWLSNMNNDRLSEYMYNLGLTDEEIAKGIAVVYDWI